MPFPIPWPDWMPAWATIALLALALLYLLVFLMMPFSVFGLKSRIDRIELLLEDLQSEVRQLSLRLPEIDSQTGSYATRPPIGPVARPPPDDEPAEEPPRANAARARQSRTEPRLNWPR